MNSTALTELREQAVALRRAGKSRREIKAILGITSNERLTQALAGEPPPAWTTRPRAKDELRAKARQLREQGLTYNQIAGQLGVSKSSISLWVRDLPRPPRLSYDEWRRRSAEGRRRYWQAKRPVLEARREAVRVAAAAEIGALTTRELIIAGAIAYWCEGAKTKPHRRQDRVVFMNSDPRLVVCFLRFLDAVCVPRSELVFRVQIHENADIDAASGFWLAVTGAAEGQFRKPTLKRHNPKTTRKTAGDDYRGCLRIEVRRSVQLYQRIDGWACGIMESAASKAPPTTSVGSQVPNRDRWLPGEDSNLG